VPVIGPRAEAGGLAGVDPLGPPGGDFGDAVARRGLGLPVFEAPSAIVACGGWGLTDYTKVSTEKRFTSGEETRLSIEVNPRAEVD
jgi:hypothetical protein